MLWEPNGSEHGYAAVAGGSGNRDHMSDKLDAKLTPAAPQGAAGVIRLA
jgi:hypothetical protein